jgi:hypothetical protein
MRVEADGQLTRLIETRYYTPMGLILAQLKLRYYSNGKLQAQSG